MSRAGPRKEPSVELSKSDRARISTFVIKKLALEEWPIIDVTLQQFGLPTTHSGGNGAQWYVMEALNDADDQTLAEIGTYLGLDLPLSAPGPSPTRDVRQEGFDLFISHIAEHKQLAGDLQRALAKFGISAFVAHEDIEPTEEWMDVIQDNLGSCDALVALLHPGFHASKWTDQEIGSVMGRGKPVFAVKMGEDPYGFIARFQAFNGYQKSATEIAAAIVKKLISNPASRTAVARGIVKAFVESPNFSESTRLIECVEALQYWDGEMLAMLEHGLEKNFQLHGERYHHVPARTEAVIDKWTKNKPR